MDISPQIELSNTLYTSTKFEKQYVSSYYWYIVVILVILILIILLYKHFHTPSPENK